MPKLCQATEEELEDAALMEEAMRKRRADRYEEAKKARKEKKTATKAGSSPADFDEYRQRSGTMSPKSPVKGSSSSADLLFSEEPPEAEEPKDHFSKTARKDILNIDDFKAK